MSTHITSQSARPYAVAFMIGAAFQALAGLYAQAIVQPDTTVSDDMWSYPWTADELVPFSLISAITALMMLAGLAAFARSGHVGASRAGRVGSWIGVAGMAVLTAAQLLSIPIKDQKLDETGPILVSVTFAVATVLVAVGMFMIGRAMLRTGTWEGWRRYAPIAAGVWGFLLLGLSPTKALPTGLAIFGFLLLAFAVAFYTRPVPESTDRGAPPVRLH
jgi:hypothetical protein